MVFYLELDLWNNVMDGVYSKNHRLITIAYLNYSLSSSHIVLF